MKAFGDEPAYFAVHPPIQNTAKDVFLHRCPVVAKVVSSKDILNISELFIS